MGSRAVDVELTRAGYHATDKLVTAVLTHENALLDGLDTHQRQQLTDTLSTLLAHLVETLDDRRPIGHVGDQPNQGRS